LFSQEDIAPLLLCLAALIGLYILGMSAEKPNAAMEAVDFILGMGGIGLAYVLIHTIFLVMYPLRTLGVTFLLASPVVLFSEVPFVIDPVGMVLEAVMTFLPTRFLFFFIFFKKLGEYIPKAPRALLITAFIAPVILTFAGFSFTQALGVISMGILILLSFVVWMYWVGAGSVLEGREPTQDELDYGARVYSEGLKRDRAREARDRARKR